MFIQSTIGRCTILVVVSMTSALAQCVATLRAETTVVDAPDVSSTNRSYVGNRAPLVPSRLIALPVGSVKPGGWLREMLQRQRSGLTGHLGEISAWLQKKDNAWLSKDGTGEYGWEELPYWLKGYIELAYLFDDPRMIAECQVWIEGTLASQRADGDFGPDQRFADGTRDYWANMVMLFCLQSYYEHSGDKRVLDLMTRYFDYQLSVPDDRMLTGYWQRMRGGDNLHSIYWLYNRTGDPKLLEVAEKIHRCTADWTLKNDLPNWHNVNIAECFREPAQFYQQSGDSADLQAAYANFHEVRKRFGQVPGGMFGGDENCREGFDDPRQATETCGFVEQMLSDAMLMQISGDPFWADHCENVAFNSYPAAVMPDFKSLRYLTAPNMVVSDAENHAPGIENSGPFLMMNPFSSRCCQHNHSHGWPYFCKHLWMATPDNGLCAAMYSASEVNASVADGTSVRFVSETNYPFEDTITLKFNADQSVEFPLYLRVPAWCDQAELAINGTAESTPRSGGKYIRIDRQWNDGDTVSLRLPMKVDVQRWKRNHNSASVNYGPLTFSLEIGHRYDRMDSTETAIGDSSWQSGADTSKWPSYEIHPTTPWNYGLVMDDSEPSQSFRVEYLDWPTSNYPFTPQDVPIRIHATAKRIASWTLDRYGLCSVLQDSPVRSDQPQEDVTLIPMGAARLRISAFPVIGSGPDAHTWVKPPEPRESTYKITASHTHQGDSVASMDDGLAPTHSGDHAVPRFTWWDHKGSAEWVQYEFLQSTTIDSVAVYWFDDTGRGECRIPQSWRVLQRDGNQWKPVTVRQSDPIAVDRWNRMSFDPIDTTALRIEVQLQPGFSGGILEWTVTPQ
ncbi:glycoside hydrolase family 127 protein [Stieleria sp. TO1_6]|uniref:beta-L-arabinofuranosidase domain-containing protein n=1 Tax=Stieleria tagensis TaxID=2956795 RepID=UPI00209BB78D|nr:beta-L-arabinofuranosidase domain-containing protein [Stieleria tagensis]MCO8124616.1 glycoside hydrolase family 127 protein [Stieleria tagensis]